MVKCEEIKIKQLDHMSDDTLWPICVIANIIANGLDKVFVTTKQNGEASS